MKLKLKVTKTLKRTLKIQAGGQEMERIDFIMACLTEHLRTNEKLWANKIESYKNLLIERQEGLKTLKDSFTDETPIEEKRERLKNYYKEHKMYRDIHSKNKKMENIILNLDENHYYGLMILAESRELTIEAYTINYLQTLCK